MRRSCDSEKVNIVLTVAFVVKINIKEALRCGGVCVWREARVKRSILCWCVYQESGISHLEDVFTINLLFKNVYKFYSFNAIFKDNAITNYITDRNEKGSFSVTFNGSYAKIHMY